ncbi:BrnT family toxin [Novosphingobium sp.]|uniref:BrnT family toxin n=1 Tax=Novosphingobium sp. TaxID=1874826 RepID=UPI00334222B2
MDVEFDTTKDAANLAKHGISLARAADLDVLAYVDDSRFNEPRFRLYGVIDGVAYCLAGTDRGGVVRAISLRRAHAKEMKRNVR